METVFESISLKGLRKTHLRQLLSYIDAAEDDGWYFGNRDEFEKRHEEIRKWLLDAVEYAYSEGVVFPK